ncbi:UDP-glucose 6-dehydrogenase TuaD [Paenibacillus tarimensis]|uniref:UDP-glucose 6-dehydrogenase TuaD n=1 Tax=Paenibacillus tarimensis TaxID=416012 RepID=UPI001F3EBA6C|nr:UDP-glucose/GDP-mannose dehydrogenase family protein [Paenibacillus tarimensis]MCF2944965.1 UDP-glucose/GDP-mannose dehydrogenase family protein [Paenibacillus tarimensis]
MKKVAVIGTGYVGLVSGTCFAEIGHQVICCDIDRRKIDLLKSGIIPIYEPGLEELVSSNTELGRLSFTDEIGAAIQASDIVFIAVGTPMSATGEADLTYVKAVAKTIGENLNDYKVVVTKSTVPVGTGRLVAQTVADNRPDSSIEFDVVSNPEFLREGTAIADCMKMERAVIGATSDKAAQIIAELHEPFNTTIFITDLESAEMIKYAANAFLATKISFINEIANLCERVGADVTEVAAGVGLDSRIGSKFLQAGIGYGGSCFPKDTEALKHIATQNNYEFKIIESVIEINHRQRLIMLDKLKEALGSVQGKHIAVLGLAFKPNTDDMRYAPSLDLIPALLKMGATVTAYDPVAIPEASKQLPAETEYGANVYDTLRGADACMILTEWNEIKEMDLSRARELLRAPIVVDGRNCFSLQEMEELGLAYYSVGRPVVRTPEHAVV